MQINKFTALAAVILTAGALQACGDESKKDADPASADTSAPEITSFNDQYPNVATKCARGTGYRIFVTTREDQPPVIVEDESC